jgi:transcriptional regulator with XRE-family HTH domain
MRRHSDSQRHSTIDAHIGSRLRQRRTLVGMTQDKLAAVLGITFQQVQKYERGVNRISGSRLYDLAIALDVPMSFFFDDLPRKLATTTPSTPLPGIVELEPSMMPREVPLEIRAEVHRLLKSIAQSSIALPTTNPVADRADRAPRHVASA